MCSSAFFAALTRLDKLEAHKICQFKSKQTANRLIEIKQPLLRVSSPANRNKRDAKKSSHWTLHGTRPLHMLASCISSLNASCKLHPTGHPRTFRNQSVYAEEAGIPLALAIWQTSRFLGAIKWLTLYSSSSRSCFLSSHGSMSAAAIVCKEELWDWSIFLALSSRWRSCCTYSTRCYGPRSSN